MTVAAPEEGVFYGKRDLLGSQAHCGHAPGELGSHQSQETLGSLGWLLLLLVYLQRSQEPDLSDGGRRPTAKADAQREREKQRERDRERMQPHIEKHSGRAKPNANI